MVKQQDDYIKEMLNIVIYNPHKRAHLCIKMKINHQIIKTIIDYAVEQHLIKTTTTSSKIYKITNEGISYLLESQVALLKYVHRLRIYDDLGGIILEKFITTKKKAELCLKQYEEKNKIQITKPYYEIDEIHVL